MLGYDTAVRLVMPKYYGGHDGMLLQLAGMSHLGCHVVVAGRIATDDQGESSFKTFEDVEAPDAITDLVRVSFTHSLHLLPCATSFHVMTVKPLQKPVQDAICKGSLHASKLRKLHLAYTTRPGICSVVHSYVA